VKIVDDQLMNCAYCDTQLAEYGGKGRPSEYCGAACRRLQEAELRRLDHRLRALDEEIGVLERHVAGIGFTGSRTAAGVKLAYVIGQRASVLDKYECIIRGAQRVPDEGANVDHLRP
jgi:hypothetical protein